MTCGLLLFRRRASTRAEWASGGSHLQLAFTAMHPQEHPPPAGRLQAAGAVFKDAADEYASIGAVKKELEAWKAAYPGPYRWAAAGGGSSAEALPAPSIGSRGAGRAAALAERVRAQGAREVQGARLPASPAPAPAGLSCPLSVLGFGTLCRDAYMTVSAPALFAPFVRLELLKWAPLGGAAGAAPPPASAPLPAAPGLHTGLVAPLPAAPLPGLGVGSAGGPRAEGCGQSSGWGGGAAAATQPAPAACRAGLRLAACAPAHALDLLAPPPSHRLRPAPGGNAGFDTHAWYQQLFDYGMGPDPAEADPEDPDANLVPTLVQVGGWEWVVGGWG